MIPNKPVITVGIGCDNFKIERFKKELDKNGYEYTIKEFTKDASIINVKCPREKVHSLKTLCGHVENHFKSRN